MQIMHLRLKEGSVSSGCERILLVVLPLTNNVILRHRLVVRLQASLRRETDRVGAVGITEKLCVAGVTLNVLPAGLLPAARHELHVLLTYTAGKSHKFVIGLLTYQIGP